MPSYIQRFVQEAPDETPEISYFIEEFNSLSEGPISDRLNREKRKLELIREFNNKVKKDLHAYIAPRGEEKESESTLKKMIKKGFYYFLLSFGLFEDGVGSYLFGQSLFALIPGISNPLLIAASVLYTLFDCILFYAFEVSMLKKALNIPFTNSDSYQLIETYQKQLKVIIALNKRMETLAVLTIDNQLYKDYLQFVDMLNDDLRQKNEAMNEYKETTPKKILKYGVISFGILSSVAGSYFWAKAFMSMCASSLLGTPIGWLIIGLTITAGLGFYYSMGAKGMSQLVNPDYAVFHQLKKNLNKFEKKFKHHIEHIKELKTEVERKPMVQMVDAETQTEPFHQEGLTFFSPASSLIEAARLEHAATP